MCYMQWTGKRQQKGRGMGKRIGGACMATGQWTGKREKQRHNLGPSDDKQQFSTNERERDFAYMGEREREDESEARISPSPLSFLFLFSHIRACFFCQPNTALFYHGFPFFFLFDW